MCCSQEEIDKVRKRQAEREAEKARREEELVGGGAYGGGRFALPSWMFVWAGRGGQRGTKEELVGGRPYQPGCR